MTKRHKDELIRAALRSRQKGTFSMIEFTYTVQDPNGMHARPAGRLATVAKQFLSDVRVRTEEKEADAKRLLALMSLGAKAGTCLTFTVSGEDEEHAAAQLQSFLESPAGERL